MAVTEATQDMIKTLSRNSSFNFHLYLHTIYKVKKRDITDLSLSTVIGLLKKSSIPAAKQFFRLSPTTSAVNANIGIFVSNSRIFRVAS